MNKTNLSNWIFYIIAWTIISLVTAFSTIINVRIYIEHFDLQEIIKQNEIANYLISDYQFIEAAIFGALFGTFNFFINWSIDQTRITRLSFGKLIFIKTLLYTIAAIIVMLLIYFGGVAFNIVSVVPYISPEFWSFFSTEFLIYIISFYIFSAILINFLVGINRKFGPGNLLHIFIGRYHKPRVEDRTFLFIDLENSTHIAEKLGHIKYSQLLQKSFLEINSLVPRHHAEIYQYVGDEIVLTWKKQRGDKNLNAIRLFFAFLEKIERNNEIYMERFSVIPKFKGGINSGEVTAAEVGLIKREIAFHGDVVNTAARVQKLCKDYNADLLGTTSIIETIPKDSDFIVKTIGKVLLKGKSARRNIYEIQKKGYNPRFAEDIKQ